MAFGLVPLSVGGTVLFSVCVLTSNNLCFFWLFLELGTLALIPSFFVGQASSRSLVSIFIYLVVSSMSSSLILCGLLYESLLGLSLLGILIKFGVFPFFGWVYQIFIFSNWWVIWSLSTLLKTPFFFLPFFFSSGGSGFIDVLCFFTFSFLGLSFWLKTYSWQHCWCHMMLSSSAALIAISPVASVDVSLNIFLFYLVWASFAVLFLSRLSFGGVGGVATPALFFFLLVSFPGTFCVFYKILFSVAMLSCSSFVIAAWALYNISEQFYLVRYLVGLKVPRGEVDYLSGV